MHWGNEYVDRPSPDQIRLAHKIIDSGANMILGHHPHVLQGVEKYHNGVIAYSLGNFIFDMWQDKMKKSMILQCILSKQGVCNVEVIPVYINNNFQPEILRGEKAKSLLSEIKGFSSRISIGNLPDFDNSVRGYALAVAINRKKFRRDVKWYFLRHLYKYPPRFILQIIKDYVKKY
jgi:poly-gamma-glutamate synthesis protein (capsule biosynthesis protein)